MGMEGRIFKVLQAPWLHHNEVIFNRRAALVDSIVHDVEGLEGRERGKGW